MKINTHSEITNHDYFHLFIYIFVLISTLFYGIIAMNKHYSYLEKTRFEKYNLERPKGKIEGLILIFGDQKSVPLLSFNWKNWLHSLITNLNKTQTIIITNEPLLWYPSIPILEIFECLNQSCLFFSSLRKLYELYPKLKWILKIDSNMIINSHGFINFLQSLPPTFHRNPNFKSAYRQIGPKFYIDSRSGWFFSKKTAFDLILKQNHNHLEFENEFLSQFLYDTGIDSKRSVDPRFVPYQLQADDFSELIDQYSKLCSNNYRYFNLFTHDTIKLKDSIILNFDTNLEERKNVYKQFLMMINQSIGIQTSNSESKLCKFSKKRNIK